MDGLSSRGQVIVIGATNRPDSIDPALRRPGRFDRELYFGLPTADDRRAILAVHTRKWAIPPSPTLLAAVAHATPGFAGADLAALCTAVALAAFERTHPHALDDERGLCQLLSRELPRTAAAAAAATAAAGAEGEHCPTYTTRGSAPSGSSSRGSTGLAGVCAHTPSRVAPPVGRHQLHPQGSSSIYLLNLRTATAKYGDSLRAGAGSKTPLYNTTRVHRILQ